MLAAFHRLDRIGQQVNHHLLHPDQVTVAHHRVVRSLPANVDALAGVLGADNFQRCINRQAQVHHRRRPLRLAGEHLELPDQLRHLVAQGNNLAQVGIHHIGGTPLQEFPAVTGIGLDRRQGLVDFMVQASRHLPQHRQLGGLDQLLLGFTEVCGALGNPALQLFTPERQLPLPAVTLSQVQPGQETGQEQGQATGHKPDAGPQYWPGVGQHQQAPVQPGQTGFNRQVGSGLVTFP